MGDVIEFPCQTVRGWADIERTLRTIFVEAAASAEMQDEVLSQMKEVFQRYNVKFSVPLELPGTLPQEQREAIALCVSRAFADYERQLHDFMNHIFLERLQLEIELYKIRHEEGEGV